MLGCCLSRTLSKTFGCVTQAVPSVHPAASICLGKEKLCVYVSKVSQESPAESC